VKLAGIQTILAHRIHCRIIAPIAGFFAMQKIR